MRQNKFVPIYNDLQDKIQNNIYEPGLKLPSENELALQYNTSRETTRKALNLLAQNGFIQKVQGKGSIVLDVNKMNFPVSGLVSFKEVARNLGKEVKTNVHELSLQQLNEGLSQMLQATIDDQVWCVVRSREIDGEKVILDKDYLLQKKIPRLTREVCEHSIYDYIENELNLTISFAKKEITVENASLQDEELLDLGDHKHVVLVKNFVYLDDATLFQYTESRHRLDKFRFVDFARRSRG
ncbi:trehalose operon repressor [Pseudalkalibacillus berkeleyi]|uniref:Trehalose operon repressor n=1 Tax=Pseudalkalibacillus berkeleyi TaxID=1069813 RepID=A0ABS9H0M0_9BACL|nr:trehalose operon repressor [Pseudalkalibacillus berkeleyi]MCF6137200.1 trehalose operon repressor [Pseudalkalibacillus berkeleyi]